MSKHIINSMRRIAPYLIEEEVVAPPKGLAGRSKTSTTNTDNSITLDSVEGNGVRLSFGKAF